MSSKSEKEVGIDWSLATWEGARREAMRRWAELPLENIIAAQEEMAEIAALCRNGQPRRNTDTDTDPGPSE